MSDNKEPWEYSDRENSPEQPETPAEDRPDSSAPENEQSGNKPETPAPEASPQNSPESPEQPAQQNPEQNPGQSYGQQGPYQNPGQSYGQQGPYQNPGQSYGRQGPYQNPGQSYGRQGPYQNPGQSYGQQGPYQNPGQSYGQQGSYQNPYSQYGSHYTNPYSQPNGQPYWNPYGQTPQQPHKMSGGLKAFLCVLAAIAVGLFGTFLYYSVNPEKLGSAGSSESSSSGSASSSDRGGILQGSASSSASSETVVSGISGDGTDPSFSGITISAKPGTAEMKATEVYKKVISSVVGVETSVYSSGQLAGTEEGTGIVATSDGYILTNAHVVNYSRSSEVKVVMQDKTEYAAKVVGLDKTSDLAVLKINAAGLSPAAFGSADDLEIGEQVLAIGNPGGLSFAGSLTGGMVSALNRTIETHSDNGMTYIQTDAAINPGNSGGPLVNMYGQVVGINSNKIVATGYEGMGFSIPLSKAQTIINELIHSGYVSGRARLGITVQNVSSLVSSQAGVVIHSIDSSSDMTRAGAQVGDIIVEADGKTISSRDDLSNVISAHKPGDVISMKLYTSGGNGSGTTKTISVKLLEDKGETQG